MPRQDHACNKGPNSSHFGQILCRAANRAMFGLQDSSSCRFAILLLGAKWLLHLSSPCCAIALRSDLVEGTNLPLHSWSAQRMVS